MSALVATRAMPVSPRVLYEFLSDLERHWLLADRFVEVLTLEREPGTGRAVGGTVRVRGPLGLARTARTRVVEAVPHVRMSGTAEVGARTRARVTWTLAEQGRQTLVRLEAIVEQAGRGDTLLLALGGRRWMRSRFAAILATLERRAVAPAQPGSE
jgi:hypothetical protein